MMISSLARWSSRPARQVGSLVQVSEFDTPTDIITHCPSIETKFPYHLAAFLYEKPPDPERAVACHDEFRRLMAEKTGARVWTVREILMQFTVEELQTALIDFSTINFRISPSPNTPADETKLRKDYIRMSLSKLDKASLIDLILLHPKVTIDADNSSSGFHYSQIPLSPLANLTFTRDQQITTAKGVVIGRFGAIQRLAENQLMKQVWPKIGVNPVGEIRSPGTLEGGDFMPVTKDLAMLGVGLRTNWDAAKQLMERDLLGTKRFVVVDDQVDKDQQRMHLDTFFNFCSEDMCVCVDAIAEDNERYLRTAVEFVRRDDGTYAKESEMPFGQWLKKEGYKVVKASFKQQEGYFLNLVHLGKDGAGRNRLLAINPEVESCIKRAGYQGDVYTIDFSPITTMYGGAHCATQILRRPSEK